MPSFKTLLDRADHIMLQQILGAPTIRILDSLSVDLARPSALRKLIVEGFTPYQILRDPNIRQNLLEFLTPEEALKIAEDLGAGGRPSFEFLKSLPIRRGSQLERVLFDALEVPPEPSVPDEQEAQPNPVKVLAQYDLFQHQRVAAGQVLAFVEMDPARVLLHMPTGAGKTRTAMHAICTHLSRHEGSMVIWLAYSEELCEQAAEQFQKGWKHLGNRPLGLHRFWGKHEVEFDDLTEGLLVAGLSKMHKRIARDVNLGLRIGGKTTLVVIDEAHQAIAPTYKFVLDLLLAAEKPGVTRIGLLGLSATPGRTWRDIAEDQLLADFFSRQKVTLKIEGYQSPVDYLIAQGYLAKPMFISIYAGGRTLSENDARAIRDGLDIPEHVLDELSTDDQRNLLIVHHIEELIRLGHRRIIVFAATVRHSALLAFVLRARSIAASSVTSSTPWSERKRAITEYREPTAVVRVLCNHGILTTGFDAPATSAAVIARPTKSLVLYMQMVGRAIRGTKAGGNAEATILTIVDPNLPAFKDVGDAFLRVACKTPV